MRVGDHTELTPVLPFSSSLLSFGATLTRAKPSATSTADGSGSLSFGVTVRKSLWAGGRMKRKPRAGEVTCTSSQVTVLSPQPPPPRSTCDFSTSSCPQTGCKCLPPAQRALKWAHSALRPASLPGLRDHCHTATCQGCARCWRAEATQTCPQRLAPILRSGDSMCPSRPRGLQATRGQSNPMLLKS